MVRTQRDCGGTWAATAQPAFHSLPLGTGREAGRARPAGGWVFVVCLSILEQGVDGWPPGTGNLWKVRPQSGRPGDQQ